MSASIANTVFLQDQKLRQLAQVIRGHEVNNMYHITFASLGEQLQYLRMANDNMASVNTILDDANAIVHRYRGDTARLSVANIIHTYVEHSLNNALQLVPNYTLRRDYLDKMIEHHKVVFETLEGLNTNNQSQVNELAEAVKELDDVNISYMRLSLNPHASAEFSRYLRSIAISFEDLVSGHQRQLGYTGSFENLEIEQKLDVYASILERSGRMSVLAAYNNELTTTGKSGDYDDVDTKPDDSKATFDLNVPVKASAVLYSRKMPSLGSAAMFLLDIGMIVWEVYSADHSLTMALREALIFAAELGGAALGKLVGVSVASGLTGMAATTLFVTAVGLVTSFVGAFIIGALAGFLFDRIFSTGGQAPLPTDGFVVYVAPMPNGHQIARQIA
ncbi:phytase [Striga asiatica]|uniref:Phytase n=1 Tax=Striga asiatica TaxID=4170 RepID=A0A5A7PH44_STRAF|nr:phytase [Striga asiatica]